MWHACDGCGERIEEKVLCMECECAGLRLTPEERAACRTYETTWVRSFKQVSPVTGRVIEVRVDLGDTAGIWFYAYPPPDPDEGQCWPDCPLPAEWSTVEALLKSARQALEQSTRVEAEYVAGTADHPVHRYRWK